MYLSIYGEVALDLMVDSEYSIIKRVGGAGLYAAITAAKQNLEVDFMTIYSSEIDKYSINLWNKIGFNFRNALYIDDYKLPKYLVTGFKAYQTKNSIPVSDKTNDSYYQPEINSNSKGILIFPINHKIPEELFIEAKKKDIIVFLDPKPNEKSIHDAKKVLKYVDFLLVNEEEAKLIAEKNNLEQTIDYFLENGPIGVIIKRGYKGHILIDKKKVDKFISYKSKVQCTLGSGDSFDAAFAASYLETKDAYHSSKLASCVAANFIESFEIESVINKKAVEIDMKLRPYNIISDNYKKIYLAAPFFSELERNWVDKICEKLENSDFKVYSPYRENGLITHESTLEERNTIFLEDLKLIKESDFVVCLLDNNDSGTNFEIGYAYSHKIPIFGLKTSTIPLNNMISHGCHSIVSSFNDLIMELKNYE